MTAYYNEIDPFAAATLRELIADGLIAAGEVDERDIRDVRPDELTGFTQHHFFAGGGIWSYALRRAGWPDALPIWTCSCPCQPFSAAGKGAGFDDERHLWPAFYWLQSQLRPECILGEQVTGGDADAWLDLVQADVEALDYAFGCVPLASAGFGAPNPRHRAFWVAHAEGVGHEWGGPARAGRDGLADSGNIVRLAHPLGGGCAGIGWSGEAGAAQYSDAYGLGNAVRDGTGPATRDGDRAQGTVVGIDGHLPWTSASVGEPSAIGGLAERPRGDSVLNPGPVNGFWRNADWLYCRDPRGPRWRPVDGGTFPLAPGHPARVGTLRISGNAINAEVATGFIEAVIDHLATPATELAA